MVPPVRVERTLLAELDFESSASTNSATGARKTPLSMPGTRGKSVLMTAGQSTEVPD